MKKLSIILLCLAFMFTACSFQSENQPPTEIVWTVKESNENYIIAENNQFNRTEYYYKIFDHSGNELLTNISGMYPDISWLNENNVQVSWGSGNESQSVFLDLENRLVSDTFNNYEAIDNRIIAFAEYDYNTKTTYLVIRDIFDLNVLYQAFLLDDSAPVANPSDLITSASFLDSSHLQITYLVGNDYQKKTIVLEFGL